MAVKKGYKHTEVGLIPEDWGMVPLGTHASFKTGPFGSLLHKSDYVNGGIPVVNPMQIIDGRIVSTPEMAISMAAVKALSAFQLCEGDVVIGRRGDMGRCAFVTSEENGWLCGTGSMIIKPKVSVHGEFLQRVLSSPPIVAALESTSVGTTMVNLNNSTLAKLRIPLPPTLAEQEAIAGALSDADAWIESLDQLIAKKRQIKQGAMQELLTGKRRLPGFSGKWETKRLGDIALLRNGYPFKSDTYAVLGSFKVVTIANVQDGRMEMAECNSLEILPRDLQVHHQLSVGDLLISMTGNVGRVCRVSHPNCLLNQRVGLVVPLSTSVEFLYNLLSQRFFLAAMARKAKGGAQGNLSKGDILEFEITIPNSLDEQHSIATVLSDMDTEIESLESKLAKAREIKQGMMQELLTGKIRLVKSSAVSANQQEMSHDR